MLRDPIWSNPITSKAEAEVVAKALDCSVTLRRAKSELLEGEGDLPIWGWAAKASSQAATLTWLNQMSLADSIAASKELKGEAFTISFAKSELPQQTFQSSSLISIVVIAIFFLSLIVVLVGYLCKTKVC